MRARTILSAAGFLLLQLVLTISVAQAQFKKPRVWVDQSSGYAIGGFDPVDYYIKEQPARPPEGEAVELYWGGVNWRFRNEGNKQAFLLHPRIYMPRFGGLDPTRLITGLAVTGAPRLFDIHKNRLYLFHDEDSRKRWRQNRASLLQQAIPNWPNVALDSGLDPQEPLNPTSDDDFSSLPAKPPAPAGASGARK